MSGPEYPIPPGSGSNAIGRFIIGVSKIGDIPPFDIWETVISQYANSDILTKLITNFAEYIDPTANFEQFFDLIWNVDTAIGYGLDVWGRIVGIGRYLQIPNSDIYFGFCEAHEPNYQGFDNGPFYFSHPLTTTYELSDSAYRKLIFAKALSNICDGSIPAINQLLINLFGGIGLPNCYVKEGDPAEPYFGFCESTTAEGFNQAPFYSGQVAPRMRIYFVFNRKLTPVELSIVQTSNVLPRPTGVKAIVVQNY